MTLSQDQLQRHSHAQILAMEKQAEKISVPFGDGSTVWRRWGSGPPLVLLHGGGGCWMHWIRSIDVLARTHTVWAPDLPYFGDSDVPGESTAMLRAGERNDVIGGRPEGAPSPPIAVIARIVADAIDVLIGEAEASLVGFSFGSAVAGHVCARLGPERVRMLVLCGGVGLTGSVFGATVPLTPWQGVSDITQFRAIHRSNLARLMIFDPEKIDDLAIDIQILGTRRARMRRAQRRSETLSVLGSANIKISGIWGENDPTAAAPFETLLERLRSVDPAAELEVIPRTGHWAAYENPDVFNAILLRLLQRAI